jgi:hypothetical protein
MKDGPPDYLVRNVPAMTCARAVARVFEREIKPLTFIVKMNQKVPDGRGGWKYKKPRGAN